MRLCSVFKLFKCKDMFYKYPKLHWIGLSTNYGSSHGTINFSTTPLRGSGKFSREPPSLDNDFYNELDPDLEAESFNIYQESDKSVRNLLYNTPEKSQDPLLNRIDNCVSVQEFFNVLKTNIHSFNTEHITLAVQVLFNVKSVYEEISGNKNEFYQKLKIEKSYKLLRNLIAMKLNLYTGDELSYLVAYLCKLGVSFEDALVQTLYEKLKQKLDSEFEISTAARLLDVIFSSGLSTISSYYRVQSLMPKIYEMIDLGEFSSKNDLFALTVCLHNLHNIVMPETFLKYLKSINVLIEQEKITSQDFQLIVKITSFLNYPHWRDKSTETMSKLILIMKDNLNNLTLNELLHLYDVFFKTQEPGEILSNLQRCCLRFIQEIDDINSDKIRLFSCLIFFSPPTQRQQFLTMISNYINQCDDLTNLIYLRRIISKLKISDSALCHKYWSKILNLYNENRENINSSYSVVVDVVHLTQHYLNFNVDLDNFRHLEFEAVMFENLERLAHGRFEFFPHKLFSILPFALTFAESASQLDLLQFLVNKLEYNWEQTRIADCIKLSLSLRLFNQRPINNYKRNQFAKKIDSLLDRMIDKHLDKNPSDREPFFQNTALLKASIYKTQININNFDLILDRYVNLDHFCSKYLETISYATLATNSLIPGLLDCATNYILRHENNLVGFNVGKLLYTCYCLGYQPKNSQKFFDICINILIRDQQRLGGLTMLQTALALCFFNKLPDSIIRAIFNEEFLDKLDSELENCYSKERYPHRVKFNMMQLNRAVCLDYPNSNVPWFHQKYIEEIANDESNSKKSNKHFPRKVRDYLGQTVQSTKAVEENITTPYGYHVDFVIKLNDKNEVVESASRATKKLAILLMPQYCYTRIFTELRGRYQLKNRHLEMLGYKVAMINYTDWIQLFFEQDKKDFLYNLIWPKNHNCRTVVNKN